jgi:multiple sugar transport system ATP-binding protein
VNDVESKDRDIAMVFQSYALYPHMTVADNMAFSLKLRKADPKMIAERVQKASKILNLDPYLGRYPRELSGGQRQRVRDGTGDRPRSEGVPLRRAAVEPRREAARRRCARRSRRSISGSRRRPVYVTHDQVEAMTMADRIVVMHDGRIEQIGTPLELYDHPSNLFVAQFIGSPAMNVVEGTVRRSGGSAHVEAAGGVRWPLPQGPGADGQPVAYGIRPEHLTLGRNGGGVPGEIVVVEPTGAETELVVQVGDAHIDLRIHGRPMVNPGDKVALTIDPSNVHVFDKTTGQRLKS